MGEEIEEEQVDVDGGGEEEGGAEDTEDEDEDEDYAELTKFYSGRSSRTTQADQ
jgi:hypothetical protein